MADEALEQEEVTVDEPAEAEDSISDIFNDDKVEAEAQAPEDPEVAEATTEPEKGEPQGEVTAEAETVEPPSTEEASQGQVPVAALLAERLKRQKAEEALAAVTPEEAEDVPDPIEDPEGYKNYLQSSVDTQALKTKVEMSRTVMMTIEPDYPVIEQEFMQSVGTLDEDGKLVNITNPALQQQFLTADNPCKFAVDYIKDKREIAELRDPSYKDRLKAEVREELIKEFGQPVPEAVKVPDLTTATAAGSNSVETVKAIESIDELFEDSPL